MKLFSAVFIIINLSLIAQTPQGDDGYRINTNNIKRHLEYLGSDLFEGRGTGTAGGDLAARYLAQEYSRINLLPLGNNNTYYQYIPMHGIFPTGESELVVYSGSETIELTIWEDYLLFRSGEQTLIPAPLSMVFVGYGIVAPEYDYNDYHSLEVEGKIVVMLDGEPRSEQASFFDGEYPTVYSFHESKMRTALSRGAAGSIIIPVEAYRDGARWELMKDDYLFEDVTLAYSVSGNFGILINPEKADLLFAGTKYSLEDIIGMHFENKIESMRLNTKMSFIGKFKRRDFIASNIIGMLEGSDEDLKDSYLIVSAHYDHLGIGPAVQGDSIYNGVLDNALGVSVLLEVANELASLPTAPKRSVIFILLTGEEKGLLGSTYYTDHPVVPLYKTIANINIDGVPVFDEFNSIVGIGSELSTLKDFLEKSASAEGLEIDDIPIEYVHTEAFNRSDQIAFAKAGIPSVLVLEGLRYKNLGAEEAAGKHKNYRDHIYHSPFDDLRQNISYAAVEQYTRFLIEFCLDLCDSDNAPEWLSGSPYYNTRLRSTAERR